MERIGKRIKQLRETYRLSQAELAKLCGSNQATIAKTETGKTAPSVKLLLWLADYFDISMDYPDQPAPGQAVRVQAGFAAQQRGHAAIHRNVL